MKSFKAFCRITMLMDASYWLSTHCIPVQKFVSVLTEANRKSQPFTIGFGLDKGVCLHQSSL